MKSKQSRDWEYIQSKSRAYDSCKQKSFYPFGRKKGAGITATPAFQEGWDRVFGKKPPEIDYGPEGSPVPGQFGNPRPEDFSAK